MNRLFTFSPIMAILLAAVIISFSGVWVKLADVPPTSSAFYRVFFGFIFLFLASLKNREFVAVTSKRGSLIFLCGLFFAIDLICWHASIGFIGPGLATILGNFQVFMLAAIGVFFLKEAVKFRFLLSIPLAIFGLFLVIGTNWQFLSDDYKTGIYLGLATAACYTGFLLSLRRIQAAATMSFYNSLMMISLCCSVLLAAIMVSSNISFIIPNLKSFMALIMLGLFSQTIGWLMITNAMPKIPASLTGLILLLQPTLSFLWDVLFFDRPTDLINWLGVLITISAIYLGITGKKTEKERR